MPIILFFFIAFAFIYAELSILIWLSDVLGIWGVILFTLFASFLGIFLIRMRGWYTLFHVRQQLNQGEIPTTALLQSGCWILAGILFFIPGFLTDIVALFLLSPLGRLAVQYFVTQKLQVWKNRFTFQRHYSFHSSNESQNTQVFEAEFERQVDEDKRMK